MEAGIGTDSVLLWQFFSFLYHFIHNRSRSFACNDETSENYASTSMAAPAPLPSGPVTLPPATITSSATTIRLISVMDETDITSQQELQR